MKNVQNAISLIHVSCDLWTSTNHLPIIVVIFHYVSKSGAVHVTVAAMREVSGSHNGRNLADVVMAVVKEWKIQNKLGYFMMDNAENNDTMMKEIGLGIVLLSSYLLINTNSSRYA
jgi:hypothetical protein